MKPTEPKKEVIWYNHIRVAKAQSGTFYVYVNGQYVTLKNSHAEVAEWLNFNWPWGTRVKWVSLPW